MSKKVNASKATSKTSKSKQKSTVSSKSSAKVTKKKPEKKTGGKAQTGSKKSEKAKQSVIMSVDDIASVYRDSKYSKESLESIASVTGCSLSDVIDQLKSVGFVFDRNNKAKTIPVKYMVPDVVSDEQVPRSGKNKSDGKSDEQCDQSLCREYSIRFDVLPRVYVQHGQHPISELERPIYRDSDGNFHVDYSDKCLSWI